MAVDATTPLVRPPIRLAELLGFFLRLGLTGFGGPAAHIALMESEAVDRRRWIGRERFLDLLGACNLLPGPSSTQVAMALGYTLSGWPGLLIGGACFILPAALATLALAWAYVRYGHLAPAQGILYGAKPVMLAVIVQAIWRLGRMALARTPLLLAGCACLVAALLGAAPIVVMLVCGAFFATLAVSRQRTRGARGFLAAPAFAAAGTAAGATTPALVPIALVFLKFGVVIFGSGYVLLAFLQADLVDRLHWVTRPQLLDAITAGQVTPGPLFATATFLGYLLHGFSGAAVATLAIFLPSFFLAAAVGALAGRMRRWPALAGFLDGVNAAAVALMAAVTLELGRAALIDLWTWALAAVSAVLLLRYRINPTWLIVAGAVVGVLVQGFAR